MIFVPGTSIAQKSSKVVSLCAKAEQSINQRDFDKALSYLKQALQKDNTYADAYILMGDVYNFTLKSDSAVQCYNRAIELIGEPDPMLYFIAANEGAKCGQYEKALQNYELFMQKGLQYTDVLADAQKGMANCRFGIEAMKNPVDYRLVNLGPNVNSEWDESLAAITADDSKLVFTVKRPKDEQTVCAFCLNEEDLYYSNRQNHTWGPRIAFGSPIKTSYNEGAQCISPDGTYLMYTMCNTDFGMGSCDLYWSKRIGDKWSRPRNFGAPVNTPDWETQPTIAADGSTIYFVSSRPGGFGGMDIWRTTMTTEGTFTAPENLGATINTPGDDAAPFIHSDGKTLYFASNGRVGMGGYDLYYSTLQSDGTWSEPQNMGYPINTPNDEINIFINASGTQAYISSDKEGGYGGLDLYSFELDYELRPDPVTYIKGVIKDFETGAPLAADIQLVDLISKQVITRTFSDEKTGEYLACIQTGTNVLLNVSHPKYPFYSENFQLEKSYTKLAPYLKDIKLRRADVGTVVVLKNIFFDFDRSDLKPESFVELDRLVDYLIHNDVKIEIGGHTDNQGTEEYNLTLSESRAKAVYEYLVSKNIPKERLSYRGYGMSQPIAGNATEEGRAENRRTEFKIVQ
ncbi:MAG: OmpA family protein [Bacteroidales bacterium]|nr:OmpA family protein [Bacteroidales bacterium]